MRRAAVIPRLVRLTMVVIVLTLCVGLTGCDRSGKMIWEQPFLSFGDNKYSFGMLYYDMPYSELRDFIEPELFPDVFFPDISTHIDEDKSLCYFTLEKDNKKNANRISWTLRANTFEASGIDDGTDKTAADMSISCTTTERKKQPSENFSSIIYADHELAFSEKLASGDNQTNYVEVTFEHRNNSFQIIADYYIDIEVSKNHTEEEVHSLVREKMLSIAHTIIDQ